MRSILRMTRSLAIIGTLVAGAVSLATPAQAQSVWYWYHSPSNAGCWNTVAGPNYGSPSYQCDYPAANFFPTSGGRTTYIGQGFHGGAWADVDGHASQSGDYCNSYPQTFTTYLDGPHYYWGDPVSRGYCYANGSLWGTNVNNNTGYVAPGAQHFASFQSIHAYPWATSSFGSNPALYVYTEFGVIANTASAAWGYVCADLIDTGGQGAILEICGDKWDWHKTPTTQGHIMGCGSLSGEKPLALPLNKYGSDSTYMTTRSGSASTSTSKTLARGTIFSMDITLQNLKNAIADAKRVCGPNNGGNWSSDYAGYRLMGVEDGQELADATNNANVNGVEQALLVATLY